jgi:hypothetical protein
MNPQRIEEFRRKLREGRPVRVVNGHMVLEQAPAGAAAPPDGAGAAAAPQGVQVKPHEWGAIAGADLPLYATAGGEARALAERALLAREYPGFTMDVDDDGTPFAHGWIGPTAYLTSTYHLLLVIPPGYGRGVMPAVHVLEPRLRPGAPHLFGDGSLCLDHSGAFTAKSTLLTLLAWASVWLVLYEGWLQTGNRW